MSTSSPSLILFVFIWNENFVALPNIDRISLCEWRTYAQKNSAPRRLSIHAPGKLQSIHFYWKRLSISIFFFSGAVDAGLKHVCVRIKPQLVLFVFIDSHLICPALPSPNVMPRITLKQPLNTHTHISHQQCDEYHFAPLNFDNLYAQKSFPHSPIVPNRYFPTTYPCWGLNRNTTQQNDIYCHRSGSSMINRIS